MKRSRVPARGEAKALDSYHSVPPYHTALKLVADNVAANEWTLRRDGEDVVDHPFWQVWNRPNERMSGYIFRWLMELYLDATGRFYAMILSPDHEGAPLSLYPVPPTAVRRRTERGQTHYEVELNDFRVKLPPEHMLVIERPDLSNPYEGGGGYSKVLGDEIETNEYISKHVASEFFNHGRPDFAIYARGAGPEESKAIKERWWNEYGGPEKSGAPAVIGEDADDFKLVELSRPLGDLQAVAVKQNSDDLIRKTLSIPPELIGQITNSNRSTIDAAFTILAKVTLTPRLTFLREELAYKLLPLFGDSDGLVLDYVSPIPEDREFMLEVMKSFPEHFTRDEIRALAEHPSRTDGAVYSVKNGLTMTQAGDVETEQQARSLSSAISKASDGEIALFVESEQKEQIELPYSPEAQQIAESIAAEDLQNIKATEARQYYEQAVLEWSKDQAAAIGGAGSVNFALLNPLIVEFAQEKTGELVKNIDATSKKDLAEVVTRAMREGKGVNEIKSEVRAIFTGYSRNRINTISRTEMSKAQGWGQWQTMKMSGVVPAREWVANFDGATRKAHALLHGQKAGIDKPFINPETGDAAMYPASFGTPSQDCNCRCTTVGWIDDESPALPEFPQDLLEAYKAAHGFDDQTVKVFAFWKSHQQIRDRQEAEFGRIMQRRFDAQLELAIEAIDRTFANPV